MQAGKKKLAVSSPCRSSRFLNLSFSKGWHFTVLLPVGMVGTGEGVVLMPLKTYSQDTDVISQHNIDEKTTQSRRKKRRKWQLLR